MPRGKCLATRAKTMRLARLARSEDSPVRRFALPAPTCGHGRRATQQTELVTWYRSGTDASPLRSKPRSVHHAAMLRVERLPDRTLKCLVGCQPSETR